MIADDRAAARFVRHPTLPLVVLSAAGVLTLIGTFVPWLHSGASERSSYELLGVLARLDIARGGAVSVLVRWWPIVPLLVTACVVAAWWRWTWWALAAAAVVASYAGGVAVTMVVAARGTGIEVGAGPWLCIVGSLALVGSAAWLAISTTRRAARAPASALRGDRS